VVDTLEEGIDMLESVLALDRVRVRRRFEDRFTVARMAQDYLKVYERQIGAAIAPNAEIAPPAFAPSGNGAGVRNGG
jgi:hypothetical protein